MSFPLGAPSVKEPLAEVHAKQNGQAHQVMHMRVLWVQIEVRERLRRHLGRKTQQPVDMGCVKIKTALREGAEHPASGCVTCCSLCIDTEVYRAAQEEVLLSLGQNPICIHHVIDLIEDTIRDFLMDEYRCGFEGITRQQDGGGVRIRRRSDD